MFTVQALGDPWQRKVGTTLHAELYMSLLEAHLLPKDATRWRLTQPSAASYRFRTAHKIAVSATH